MASITSTAVANWPFSNNISKYKGMFLENYNDWKYFKINMAVKTLCLAFSKDIHQYNKQKKALFSAKTE